MDRGVQIEEGGVSDPLPPLARPDQADAALPEVGPGFVVEPAQGVEPVLRGGGQEAHGLAMRLVMQHVRDQGRHLAKAVTAGPGL